MDTVKIVAGRSGLVWSLVLRAVRKSREEGPVQDRPLFPQSDRKVFEGIPLPQRFRRRGRVRFPGEEDRFLFRYLQPIHTGQELGAGRPELPLRLPERRPVIHVAGDRRSRRGRREDCPEDVVHRHGERREPSRL